MVQKIENIYNEKDSHANSKICGMVDILAFNKIYNTHSQ